MWTRAEVKSRAKQALKQYYWYAVLMCFIAAMLGGENAGGGNVGGGSSISANWNFNDRVPEKTRAVMSEAELGIAIVLCVVVVLAVALAIAFSIFVSNLVQVGLKRYMLESRALGRSAGIAKLFWAFSCGSYLNVAKIMFLKNLYTTLWSLLFVVPGVVKSYEYSMIPYILAENPELPSGEVFRISREMTMGEKANLFVLDLSFIGWILLGGIVCCGLGSVFLDPYIEATYAEVYMVLRGKVTGVRFNGFGDEVVYVERNEYSDPFADYDRH